jgi:hypothetical protein
MGNFMTRDSRAIRVPSPIARLSPLVSLLLRFSDIGRAVAISASGKNYRAAAPQDAKRNRAKRKAKVGGSPANGRIRDGQSLATWPSQLQSKKTVRPATTACS